MIAESYEPYIQCVSKYCSHSNQEISYKALDILQSTLKNETISVAEELLYKIIEYTSANLCLLVLQKETKIQLKALEIINDIISIKRCKIPKTFWENLFDNHFIPFFSDLHAITSEGMNELNLLGKYFNYRLRFFPNYLQLV